MTLTFRILGLELYVSFGPESEASEQESYQLTTTDHSFGFAGPVEYFFTDDEDC